MTQNKSEETEEPDAKKPRLSDEEYQVLRKKLKDRKRALLVILPLPFIDFMFKLPSVSTSPSKSHNSNWLK